MGWENLVVSVLGFWFCLVVRDDGRLTVWLHESQAFVVGPHHLRSVSISRKMSYCKLSWNLEDMVVRIIISFAIWQASRQHGCRDSCQISKRLDSSKCESHGFETFWDLTARRLIVYWIGPLVLLDSHINIMLIVGERSLWPLNGLAEL